MNLTPIAKPVLKHRVKHISEYATYAEQIQRDVLRRLIDTASATEWGVKHSYSDIACYEQFAKSVAVQDYESLKGYIDRMRHGEKDVLWKGRCKWFAKSSGTTNDKSKFIPVTPQGLKNVHYKGAFDVVAQYVANNPSSRILSGKGLILGGSHAPNYNLPDSLVGDLSAILIENCSPLVNLFRVPGKEIALLGDFEEKMEKIACVRLRREDGEDCLCCIYNEYNKSLGCSVVDDGCAQAHARNHREDFGRGVMAQSGGVFSWRCSIHSLS